jgi:DNA-binding IclR family transcriptional regulator/enamine deaminase RidA (YjgF/YER057c/UK114 family)
VTAVQRTPKNGSVRKAFRILAAIARSGREMNATEVARAVGDNLPTVHRFLLSLEEVGAVVRGARGRYQLGIALAELGDRVEHNKLFLDCVQPHLNALAARFREISYAAVRSGAWARAVAHSLSDRSLHVGFVTGELIPLHCSAVGKVLLAGLATVARDQVLAGLEITPRTARTLTDPVQLRRQVAQAAADRYAIDDEELEDGLRSVAVPIYDAHGETMAALAVSAPMSRMDGGILDACRAELQLCAAEIERKLFTESRVFSQKARPRGSFPHLKRVGDLVFISGTSARRPDDTFEGAGVAADGTVTLDMRRQARAVFNNIRDMLSEIGATLTDVVEVNAYMLDMVDYGAFNEVYAEFFDATGPARTTVAVKELPHPHQLLMIKATAYKPLPAN